MRDKNVAALLAFFLGGFGVHRFYLGQMGMGIMYIVFFFISPLLGFIDFIRFLMMSQEEFDFKYNRQYIDVNYREQNYRRRQRPSQEQNRRQYDRGRDERRSSDYGDRRQQKERHRQRRESIYNEEQAKRNPYKVSGKQRLKNYEYHEAVKDLRKSLTIEPNDVEVHFALASAYSLLEAKAEGFHHLKKAIALGFSNFSKIETDPNLAYLRTQQEYEVLEDEFYGRNKQRNHTSGTSNKTEEPDLLEQLKMLGDLKQRGLLTEEEFVTQKKKLLR